MKNSRIVFGNNIIYGDLNSLSSLLNRHYLYAKNNSNISNIKKTDYTLSYTEINIHGSHYRNNNILFNIEKN